MDYSDVYYCRSCKQIISKHKERRHKDERCGVKASPKGPRPTWWDRMGLLQFSRLVLAKLQQGGK